jgi:hypothetical protein
MKPHKLRDRRTGQSTRDKPPLVSLLPVVDTVVIRLLPVTDTVVITP